jgi:hypothetical protein
VYFDKRDVDVIFGRGTGPNVHNQPFREQVRSRHEAYVKGNEVVKVKVVNDLKEWVQNRGRPIPRQGFIGLVRSE